ncbi:DNA recombination protein RmuC [Candidatus Uhrbacteria bacterium]|nr:DNA recombination protein RmuC [Candidatus Uhrbacteria bacterium]
MNILLFIIIGLLAATGGIIIAWFFLRRRGNEGAEEKNDGLLLIQNQLNELGRVLDTRLGEQARSMHDSVRTQFGESQKLIRDITAELTHVKETSRQVAGFAEQLQSLQDVLQNPKQRGVLGEYYLESVLQNVLPPGRFQMQYKFGDGEIVDAVIFLEKGKMLPIDSKFSLENYNRILETRDPAERERLEKLFKQDLKNRIDETSKYIRPNEGTMDFAFMFIPSEAIFYDLLINQVGAVKTNTRDLIEYSFQKKRVIIVSPTSFLAYLQTVLQGLKSLQIEEQAQEIIKRVGELGRHIDNYDSFMHKLGGSLATTVSHFNTAHKELKKIDKDVVRIADKETGVEPLMLEKPQLESGD